MLPLLFVAIVVLIIAFFIGYFVGKSSVETFEVQHYLLGKQIEENQNLRSEIAGLNQVITRIRQKWVAPNMQWQAAQELNALQPKQGEGE